MGSPTRKIGRFEIRRELGRGMMGVVYEAHDPALTRTVALKTVNPGLADADEERAAFERRFESEARIAGRLSHPHIVVVHDVGRDTETGVLYIALEHVPGETLEQILRTRKGKPLPWRDGLRIGRQLADALHHAHAQGIVHRDIKPANVMRLPSGDVKLMDFGIAKLEAAQLTAAGQFFGTPLFMCPEQAASGSVDGRSDIFSLGSVLYTLLTGRHAFAANTIAVIVYRVTHEDPTPPTEIEPSLPREVDYILARCLAKAPGDRYADAQQLSEDLSDVLEGRPPRHRREWTPPPPVRPGRAAAPPELAPPVGTPTVTVDRNADGRGALGTRTLAASALPDRTRRRRGRLLGGIFAGVWTLALAIGLLLPQLGSLARKSPLGSEESAAAGVGGAAGLGEPSAASDRGAGPGRPSAASDVVAGPAGASAVTIPEPSPAEATPKPTPEATPKPTPLPARIVVDFRHPLRSGSLRVWMDDEPVLGESIRGRVAKDLLVVKLRSGVYTDVIEVEPGRHDFRVDIRWDDELRSERIHGRLLPGETYRLEIRLGRIKKDLSLKWTR